MMRILEALYNGNLLAEPVIETRSPEHQKAIDTAHRRVEALAEKLNADEREMLDSVTEAMNEESDYFAAERFIRGYCLGALMMLEVMEKREELVIPPQEN